MQDYKFGMLCFANALSYLLETREGIVVSGIKDGENVKIALFKDDDECIKISLDSPVVGLAVGTRIKICDNKDDAILNDALDLDSDGFIIDD